MDAFMMNLSIFGLLIVNGSWRIAGGSHVVETVNLKPTEHMHNQNEHKKSIEMRLTNLTNASSTSVCNPNVQKHDMESSVIPKQRFFSV